MIKKLLVAPVLSLLLLNAVYAGTAENINELIDRADRWSFNPEKMDVSWTLNEQAQAIAEKVQDNSPVFLLKVLTQKVELYIKSKQLEQAQKICLQIFAFKEKNPKLTGIPYADFLHKYAELMILQGQLIDAEKASLQAIEYIGKASLNKTETRLDEEFAFLGKIYMQQKEWYKAETYLRLAVFLNKPKEDVAFGKDNSYKRNAVLDLIKVYQETKRDDLAKQMEADMKPFLNKGSTIFAVSKNPKYKDPTLIKETCPNPPFPNETIPYAMEGTMSLAFLIADDDQVIGKYVTKTSDWKRFDDITINALSQCKFKAATIDGQAVLGWMYYQYDWKVNQGGKPFPKPELIEGSCKSDSYDLLINDTKAPDNIFSFKISPDGKPYDTNSDLMKKNDALFLQLNGMLKECKFKPTVIDGEARGNKATIRFVRKPA